MIILQKKPDEHRAGHIVLVFGTGLIGTAICRSIEKRDSYFAGYLPFTWGQTSRIVQDGKVILEYLETFISPDQVSNPEAKVSVVWSAGTTGFLSSREDTEEEMSCFNHVLELVDLLIKRFPVLTYSFHLISSAGGLFEGCRLVDENTPPDPKHNYGFLKYEQEKKVSQADNRLTKRIYRPTSVYGFIREGYRKGLIGTLLTNGLWNRVSTIYGGLSTLRDYVFSGDVGNYVADRLLTDTGSRGHEIHLLGSGKPCSIQEIRHDVEHVLGRKIYLQFVPGLETGNDMDIVFNPSQFLVPWYPMDVRTGISTVKERIFSQNSRKFSAQPIIVN